MFLKKYFPILILSLLVFSCDEEPEGCDGISGSGLINDECGVCDGDNSTCLGCDNIPNSGLVNDECGVCDGDNSSCADCAGTPNGDAWESDCGCVAADNSGDD